MLGDYVISVIRTVVPAAVGLGLAWLAQATGVGLSPEATAEVTLAAAGLATAAYYAAVRALEARWPRLGWLLGSRQQPTYVRGD